MEYHSMYQSKTRISEWVVDLNKCFVSGQAYVALSRVTSINGLYTNVMDSTEVFKTK